MLERFTIWRSNVWQRFILLAQGKHALFWLGVCALTDPIFFPIAPEVYLAALILAHKERWKTYLIICITCSVTGAAIGYFVGAFLFHQFGEPLLHFYHLEHAFTRARHLLTGRVFIGMILVAFSPIPEKVFVLASGFLGLFFPPYLLGFLVGRSIRLGLTTYLIYHYGMRILEVINRYFFWFALVLLAILGLYGIVHWHLLPL